MPHYEFFCQECKKLFDKILSLVDYEEGEVLCPHCGSKKVEQWSAFSASTAKKGDKIVPILKKQPGFVNESVTSGSSTTVFALRCSPCSKPNQSCARLRSIPQPATRSQPARLHKSNFKNDHEGEPTGSPYSYEASCRPLLLAFSNSLEYGGQRVAVFHFSHNVDAQRLRGFVKLLNREEQ